MIRKYLSTAIRTTEKEEKITKVDWLEAEIWQTKY